MKRDAIIYIDRLEKAVIKTEMRRREEKEKKKRKREEASLARVRAGKCPCKRASGASVGPCRPPGEP